MDEKKKLTEDELAQVSGGSSEGNVITDCYYCGQKHLLHCVTGLQIIPHGLKKSYNGASKYFCTFEQNYFYVLTLPNGGTAIFDNDMKIVK